MNEDFFKTCFDTVAGLEVENESQAIAKEVVLDEIENLQQENKQLKEQKQELRSWLEEQMNQRCSKYERWALDDCLNKLNELEGKNE